MIGKIILIIVMIMVGCKYLCKSVKLFFSLLINISIMILIFENVWIKVVKWI